MDIAEIRDLVAQYLYDEHDRRDLTSFMCVCNDWFDTGMSIAWRDAKTVNFRYVRSPERLQKYANGIKTLDVMVPHRLQNFSFPQLQHVRFVRARTNAPHFDDPLSQFVPFLSRRIQSIWLVGCCPSSESCDAMAQTCVNVQSLAFYYGKVDALNPREGGLFKVSYLVQKMPGLREVYTGVPRYGGRSMFSLQDVGSDFLPVLFRHKNLEHLSLGRCFNQFNDPKVLKVAFENSKLESIRLGGERTPITRQDIIRLSNFRCLKKVAIFIPGVEGFVGRTRTSGCLLDLGRSCPQATEFAICGAIQVNELPEFAQQVHKLNLLQIEVHYDLEEQYLSPELASEFARNAPYLAGLVVGCNSRSIKHNWQSILELGLYCKNLHHLAFYLRDNPTVLLTMQADVRSCVGKYKDVLFPSLAIGRFNFAESDESELASFVQHHFPAIDPQCLIASESLPIDDRFQYRWSL